MKEANAAQRKAKRRALRYPAEIEIAIRYRLQRFLNREGLTRLDFAYEISCWPTLTDWIPAAEEWQALEDKSSDGAGYKTQDIKEGKKDQGWPLTGRIFERWLRGEVSRDGSGTWIFPAPERIKLDIIAHYLIERGVLDKAELAPDDRGFGIANALQAYVGSDHSVKDQDAQEGTFEAFEKGDRGPFLHRVRLQKLGTGPLFLVYGNIASTAANLSPQEQKRLSDRGVTKESGQSGWGVPSADGALIAFLKPVFHASRRPKAWVFRLTTERSDRIFALNWCGDDDVRLDLPSPISRGSVQFRENLQTDMEIDYSLKRSGDDNESIICRILGMDDFKNASKGEKISELDQKLFAAVAQYIGDLTELRALLDAGANLNVVDPVGKDTPLLYAAYRGQVDVVEFLVRQPDIDVLLRNREGLL